MTRLIDIGRVQEVFEEQGFLVLAIRSGIPVTVAIGQPLTIPAAGDGFDIPGPFFVVADSNRNEFLKQCETMAGGSRPQDIAVTFEPGVRFVRVVAE